MSIIRRAIIYGPGGLAGAHSAGSAVELCKFLGPDYFETYVGCSVGNTIATFHASNQPDIIEEVWTRHVDGNKLVNPNNLLKLHPLLNLGYLKRIFQNDIAKLDSDTLFNLKRRVQYILLDYNTGKVSLEQPTKENIIDLMLAGCALPVLNGFPGYMQVDGRKFIDCSFVSGSIPISALEQVVSEHDEIVLVLNYPKNYKHLKTIEFMKKNIYPIIGKFYPKHLQEIFANKLQREKEFNEFLKGHQKIKVIRPAIMFPNSGADKSKASLILTLAYGKLNARTYRQALNL